MMVVESPGDFAGRPNGIPSLTRSDCPAEGEAGAGLPKTPSDEGGDAGGEGITGLARTGKGWRRLALLGARPGRVDGGAKTGVRERWADALGASNVNAHLSSGGLSPTAGAHTPTHRPPSRTAPLRGARRARSGG